MSGVAEADKAGAAKLAAVGQQGHAAGAGDGQFLGEGLVGIGGRQPRLGGEADRAHEGPVELDALEDRAREGSDEGLAEPAALAAGEDHARPAAAEQLRDAQRIGHDGELRQGNQHVRQGQDRAAAIQKHGVGGTDQLERGLGDRLLLGRCDRRFVVEQRLVGVPLHLGRPAMHAAEASLLLEFEQVAAHRGGRDLEPLGQLIDPHDMLRLQARADALLPLDRQIGIGGFAVHLRAQKIRNAHIIAQTRRRRKGNVERNGNRLATGGREGRAAGKRGKAEGGSFSIPMDKRTGRRVVAASVLPLAAG